MLSGCCLCVVLEPANGCSPPARDPFDTTREARFDASPCSRSASMLPRRLRFGLDGEAAVPDAERLPVPSSSSSSGWALCLLPSTCAGGMDENGNAASLEADVADKERLGADDGEYWDCSGGRVCGIGVWEDEAGLEEAKVGWADGFSDSDGIWIGRSLGGWSATAIEFGSVGPMDVPTEDLEVGKRSCACRHRKKDNIVRG